jgi:hypothetical protein
MLKGNALPLALGADGIIGFLTSDQNLSRYWIVLLKPDGHLLSRYLLPKAVGPFGALWVR